MLAPTAAAVLAALATLWTGIVARRVGREAMAATKQATDLTKLVTRPRLHAHYKISATPNGEFTAVRFRVANHGQTLAEIESLNIFVDGNVRRRTPQETPAQFWEAILAEVDLVAVRILESATHEGATSVDPDSELLFIAFESGEPLERTTAFRERVRVRCTYKSTWGDTFHLPRADDAAGER